jgi:hypothetical protein
MPDDPWIYCVFIQYFAMDTLPQFDPPRYDELREWWMKYRGNSDIRRLILEVQTQRYALSEMRDIAESARNYARQHAPETLGNDRSLTRLHRRLEDELRRGGQVYPEYKFSKEYLERRSGRAPR